MKAAREERQKIAAVRLTNLLEIEKNKYFVYSSIWVWRKQHELKNSNDYMTMIYQ